MGTTLFLLVYATILLPVMVVISYLFIKVLQEAEVHINKPYRVKKMSTREHRELFEAAFIAPMRIKPFPPDTHHEKETKQQSEKTDLDRTTGE